MFEQRLKLPHPVRHIRAILPKTMRYRNGPPEPVEPEPSQETVIAELEKTYQERSEAAYKNGIEDGTEMGLEQGRQEIKVVMEQLGELTRELEIYRSSLIREVDEIVTQLSLSIVKVLIQRTVTEDPELIKDVVKEALRQVEDRRRIVVKVHPEDWTAIKTFEPEIREAMHSIREIEIKEDAQIRRGGCLIESDSGIVDARIDTQIEEIAAGLLGAY
ncbi:hypothetical protein KAR48_00995 [bacterium]|nr:hypothetical protein [bacterium]